MHFPAVELNNVIRLAPFPECQGSCGLVPSGLDVLVVFFNMLQGLKCPLHSTTKFLGVFSKTYCVTPTAPLLDPRPSDEFSGKMRKFLRSLVEYLVALAFLCCHCIFDRYIACFNSLEPKIFLACSAT